MINEKSLITLEFNKILEKLEAYAASREGKKKCRSLVPFTEIGMIERSQQETEDALSRIIKNGAPSFSGLKDIKGEILRLQLEGALSQKELLDIASSMETACRVKAYGGTPEEGEEPDSLQEYFDGLFDLGHVSREIGRCIISEDEMADDASSALKDIRRKMKNAGEKIRVELNRILSREASAGTLQENIITMRSGRYVIPVRAEHKSKIRGLVHDQSSSGSTVFIEPMAVVELNNEIRELESKELEEINRILKKLSEMAAEYKDELRYNLENLTELDFIFAKGHYAKETEGIKPSFNTIGTILLKKARHPLIDRKKVVPIDMMLGEDYRMMIITGPNTGGKTVSLKTTGLLCLMGQAGLHIPAGDGSSLFPFRDIFADIGDEQSIEQSLSTFSSHMTNLVKIINDADKNSLVLLDELCSGTDPTEGAALAMAMLKNFLMREVRVIATTHYSELKVFALSTKGVINGSCEFDVGTLSPTYRLLIGIPGKSNAFAIAEKLGLPGFLIDDARKRLDSEDVALEDVISELEDKRTRINKDLTETEKAKLEAEKLRDALKKQEEKIEDRKEKIISEAKREAAEILKKAKDTADSTIKELNKLGAADGRSLERIRGELREELDKVSEKKALGVKRTGKEFTEKDAAIGTFVKVLSMNTTGRIIGRPNKAGEVEVQMGIIRANIKLTDLEPAAEQEITGPSIKGTGAGRIRMQKTSSISSSLNLIGLTTAEALGELDKYLDDAYLSRLESVQIVHGKGTGALRNAVHKKLKETSFVKDYRLGNPGEGDAGVTIVTFK